MKDRENNYYYRAVPGSRDLVTRSDDSDESLALIEGEENGKGGPAPLRSYRGEFLGGAKVDGPIGFPAEVFDLLAPLQTPLEQAVYMHLFRLSYGEGKNFCRVGKRELADRARLSDRRLNVSLDGLVRKNHVKPLHRNTKGTLYRVYLPSEVLDEVSRESGVTLGEIIEPPAAEKVEEKAPARRERPLESPLNEERFSEASGKKPKGPSLGDMADRFLTARKGEVSSKERQLAITVITELLEDGFSRDEVDRAVDWFIENAPEEKSLDRLPYYMTKALGE